MNKIFIQFILILVFISYKTDAQDKSSYSFKVVPLGVKGGSDESNLSAYAIAPAGTNKYVCADAGTIRAGIDKAIVKRTFAAKSTTVLKQYIKGYLISHGHLDHVSGLIINSPDDTAKNIYAMPNVVKTLRDKYFSWESWANFADEGEKPTLNKYHYVPLNEKEEIPVANTGMTVKAFSLSHVNPYLSTAFLLKNNDRYLLYFGDTGADEVEKSDKLLKVWQYIAPLIKRGELKAIFIEVSFPDEQPDKLLFGHLTPRLLMNELNVLASEAGIEFLKKVPIVITHIKPPIGNEIKIKAQLRLRNKGRLNLQFPEQGKLMKF